MRAALSTVSELRKLGFDQRAVDRAQRKSKGGAAGKAGFRYEDYFASAQILAGCVGALRGKKLAVAEAGVAFVDDVVVVRGERIDYHQLKSGTSVGWSALEDDFRNQKAVCRKKALAYRLVLVVKSATRAAALAAAVPRGLRGDVDVVHFAKHRRLQELADAAIVKSHASRLLGVPDPTASYRRHLVDAIFLAWNDRRSPTTFLDSGELLSKLRRRDELYVVMPYVDNSQLWLEARRVLRRIPGLEFSVATGHFWFRFAGGVDMGVFARCGTTKYRRLLKRIVANQPGSFEDLEALR